MAKKAKASETGRIRRKDPARSAPNRSVMDHLRRNSASKDNPRKVATPNTRGLVPEALQQGMADVVKLGYGVIEQQIREGQSAAERLREGITNSKRLNSDVTNLIEGLVATTRDVGATWLDLLAIVVRSLAPQATRAGEPPSPQDGPARATTTGKSGAAVTVSSITPADPASPRVPPTIVVSGGKVRTVTLDLHPPSVQFVPFVGPLHAANRKHGVLKGVSFGLSADTTQAVLTVRVRPSQAVGIYSGAIVDSTTKEFGGTVSVTVGS